MIHLYVALFYRAAKPPAGSLICSTFSDISGDLDGYGARSAPNFSNDSLICSTLSTKRFDHLYVPVLESSIKLQEILSNLKLFYIYFVTFCFSTLIVCLCD